MYSNTGKEMTMSCSRACPQRESSINGLLLSFSLQTGGEYMEQLSDYQLVKKASAT
jgi:hypothetical protein